MEVDREATTVITTETASFLPPYLVATLVTIAAIVAATLWYRRLMKQRKQLQRQKDEPHNIPEPLRERFDAVCQYIKKSNRTFTQRQQLSLYGWYKQAEFGNVTGPEPLAIDLVAKAKYEAWKANYNMPRAAAMQAYIEFVIQYEFTKQELDDQADIDWDKEEKQSSTEVMNNMGFKPSTLNYDDPDFAAAAAGGFQYLLHWAAREGNVAKLQEIFSSSSADGSRYDVNGVDESGQTALHLAADSGHVDCLKYLLSVDGINVQSKDQDGFSPLHVAVIASQLESCRVLLRSGADPLQPDNDGETPLTSCDKDDDPEIYKLLIEYKNKIAHRNANKSTNNKKNNQKKKKKKQQGAISTPPRPTATTTRSTSATSTGEETASSSSNNPTSASGQPDLSDDEGDM